MSKKVPPQKAEPCLNKEFNFMSMAEAPHGSALHVINQ